MISDARAPHFGQVIMERRMVFVSGIARSPEQEHGCCNQPGERQMTLPGRLTGAVWTAMVGKPVLPVKRPRPDGETRHARYNQHGSIRACGKGDPCQPGRAQPETHQQHRERATRCHPEGGGKRPQGEERARSVFAPWSFFGLRHENPFQLDPSAAIASVVAIDSSSFLRCGP